MEWHLDKKILDFGFTSEDSLSSGATEEEAFSTRILI